MVEQVSGKMAVQGSWFPTHSAKVPRNGWGTLLLSCVQPQALDLHGKRKIATGIRAQHSMNGLTHGLKIQAESGRRDQICNLEATFASDTVNREVKTDSFRCVFLLVTG
jgi:hypothetical protein